MRACCGIAGLVLAALLPGCAYDPHPASPDTPGDPWHPPSSDVPAGGPDQAAVAAPAPAPAPVSTPAPAPETHDAKQMR